MKEAVLLLAKERVRRIKKLFPGSKRPNMKQLPRWSQIFDKSKPLPGPGRAKRIIRHPHLQEIEFFPCLPISNNGRFHACGHYEDDVCVGWNSTLHATFASASANNTLIRLYLFFFLCSATRVNLR